jgi:aminoglycoside 6-adenylyltransferase
MDEVVAAYEKLIDRFVGWAQGEDNLRAAVVIGSRARADHAADEWSDLDVILLARDPQPYLTTTGWLHSIGVPWLTFIEPAGAGEGFERRVLFAGGLDVDFAPDRVDDFQRMLEEGIPPVVADIVQRGVRVLVDKDNLWDRLFEKGFEPLRAVPPDESEFLNLVNDFWYHTVWTAKHLRRGELWWAKSGCDMYLKHLLRQMMEWHTHALKGGEVDTWMRGRFLEEWVDPRVLASLPSTFAHYEEEDTWSALLATMDLFGWLAMETAGGWRYSYPLEGEAHARECVASLFQGRESRNGVE